MHKLKFFLTILLMIALQYYTVFPSTLSFTAHFLYTLLLIDMYTLLVFLCVKTETRPMVNRLAWISVILLAASMLYRAFTW